MGLTRSASREQSARSVPDDCRNAEADEATPAPRSAVRSPTRAIPPQRSGTHTCAVGPQWGWPRWRRLSEIRFVPVSATNESELIFGVPKVLLGAQIEFPRTTEPFGTPPAAVVLLFAIAVLAILAPARRALRIDPTTALREE